MKTQINKLVLLFLAVFAISCSNDSDSETPYEVKENRILKEMDDKTTKTYTYNGNQLTKVIEIGDLGFGTTQMIENYTYGTDGKVTMVKSDYTGSASFGFRTSYTYNNVGKIDQIHIEKYTETSDYSYYIILTYDYTTTNVVKRLEERIQEGSRTLTIYDITNGNPSSYSVYKNITPNTPNGQLSYTSLYSDYDTKKTPYTALPLVYREPSLFTNNPGKTQSSGSTTNYTYEYNDDGYPTKITMSYNNTTSSTTYQYERI